MFYSECACEMERKKDSNTRNKASDIYLSMSEKMEGWLGLKTLLGRLEGMCESVCMILKCVHGVGGEVGCATVGNQRKQAPRPAAAESAGAAIGEHDWWKVGGWRVQALEHPRGWGLCCARASRRALNHGTFDLEQE